MQIRRENSNVTNISLPVAAGRQHLSVQTDLYLEELCDVVETADAECETDPLLDRPPSPLFIPAKSGIDVETQIYPGEVCLTNVLFLFLFYLILNTVIF